MSILFALTLTVLSSLIGVTVGALQGYYGGWVDLLGQRFLEVWSGLPVLYLLIILASFVQPNFWCRSCRGSAAKAPSRPSRRSVG